MFSGIRTLQIYFQENKRKKPKKLWRQAQSINKVIFSTFSDRNWLLNWSLLVMQYILMRKYQQQITTASVYVNAASKHVCRPTLSKFHAGILNTTAKNVHFVCSHQIPWSFIFVLFFHFPSLHHCCTMKKGAVGGGRGRKRKEQRISLASLFHMRSKSFSGNLACNVLCLVSIQTGMS